MINYMHIFFNVFHKCWIIVCMNKSLQEGIYID